MTTTYALLAKRRRALAQAIRSWERAAGQRDAAEATGAER